MEDNFSIPFSSARAPFRGKHFSFCVCEGEQACGLFSPESPVENSWNKEAGCVTREITHVLIWAAAYTEEFSAAPK